MVASKVTARERLLRKRANARLRQQRCRARKREKMDSHDTEIERTDSEDSTFSTNQNNFKPIEDDHKILSHTNNVIITHSSNLENHFIHKEERERNASRNNSLRGCSDNIHRPERGAFVPVAASRSVMNIPHSLHVPQEKLGERDLRQDAIEAMLSLRFNNEDSSKSAVMKEQLPPPQGIPKCVRRQGPRPKYYYTNPPHRPSSYPNSYHGVLIRKERAHPPCRPGGHVYVQSSPPKSYNYHQQEPYSRRHHFVPVSRI